MEIREQFVAEVDECLDQAQAEGWVVQRGTAATVAVTFGVLITRLEAMGHGPAVVQVKRCIQQALDFVA